MYDSNAKRSEASADLFGGSILLLKEHMKKGFNLTCKSHFKQIIDPVFNMCHGATSNYLYYLKFQKV